MKRNWKRFMAWILIATMVLGSNTVTVFAEELSDGFTSEDIIFEEPTVVPTEEPTVEPTVVPTVEPTVAPTEEPTEIPTEMPTPVFEQGYVRVSGGTSVYKTVNGEEAGRFLNDAYVYGIVEHRAEEIDNDWLKITFDTAYNRENGIALYEGFVKGNRVKVLTQEDADDLYNRTAYETGVRSYRNFYLPATQYEEYATKQAEEVIGEEPPVEEEQEPALDAGYEDAQDDASEEAALPDDSVEEQDSTVTETNESIETESTGTVENETVAAEDNQTEEALIDEGTAEDETEDDKQIPGEEEAAPFENGYVRLSAGTAVYTTEECNEELGTVDKDAIVYAELVSDGTYKVFFDTEDGSAYIGFVKGEDIAFLSEEDTVGITGREYNGFFIPVILFTAKINGLTDGLWVYEVVEDYARVLGYLDYEVTSLSIPDQLGGYYVNAIGEKAFVKNTALTNMYIHGNVISIADDAFASRNVVARQIVISTNSIFGEAKTTE